MKLIKSHDLQGLHMLGGGNAKLGLVREIFIDLETGAAEFLVVESASLLGNSGKFHPVPWSAVRFDSVANAFQVQMDKDLFKTSPSYDREQLANPNFGWSQQSLRFFATAAEMPPSRGAPPADLSAST